MCDVFLPDMFVDVPGPLQDVGQCEAGGSDTADDGPSHNVIGVVGQVVQVGLEKITNLTQIIKVHILWFVIPSSKMLTKKFYRRNIECIFPFGSKWYEFFTIKRMAKKLQSFRLKYL